MELNKIIHADCMDVMKDIPDKYFNLAICDPPYGIGKDGGKIGGDNLTNAKNYLQKNWDREKPKAEYFTELFRISQNQIVFGANHFISSIPFDSPCWIVWDKDNTGNFADCELGWTSFNTAVRIFRYRWNGMIQENMKNKEHRIHPTQKPVALYKWLLHNYAKQGDKILDTHSGSGTTAMACIDMGFDYLCIEKDKDYYEASVKRIDKENIKIKMDL